MFSYHWKNKTNVFDQQKKKMNSKTVGRKMYVFNQQKKKMTVCFRQKKKWLFIKTVIFILLKTMAFQRFEQCTFF